MPDEACRCTSAFRPSIRCGPVGKTLMRCLLSCVRHFTCRSGLRTAGACDRLAARISGPAYVLSGGVDSWDKAGLALTVDAKAPLEIMRQVQIAAGLLVLTGIALGIFVAPGWLGLSAFVGSGLAFAGATGFCGMARLLMLAPWNRRTTAA